MDDADFWDEDGPPHGHGVTTPLLGLTNLRSLDITQCLLGAEGLQQLGGALTQLTHLGVSFSGDDWLSSGAEELVGVLAGLPLRSLSFPSSDQPHGVGAFIGQLSRLTRLTQLTGGIWRYTWVPEGVLAATLQQLSNLQALQLEGTLFGSARITPSRVRRMPEIEKLVEKLHFTTEDDVRKWVEAPNMDAKMQWSLANSMQLNAAMDGDDVRSVLLAIAGLPKLQQLALNAFEISYVFTDWAALLPAATQLKKLWLGWNAVQYVPRARLEQLRQSMPSCEVVVEEL